MFFTLEPQERLVKFAQFTHELIIDVAPLPISIVFKFDMFLKALVKLGSDNTTLSDIVIFVVLL
jgi:hypothetical protein